MPSFRIHAPSPCRPLAAARRPVSLPTPLPALISVVLAACAHDGTTTAPPPEPTPQAQVTVCEGAQTIPVRRSVDDSATALTALLAVKAYPIELRVDPKRSRNNGLVFRRITDALAEARRIRSVVRNSGCRIAIRVDPGLYVGTTAGGDTTKEQLPLRIDVPNLSLQGSTRTIADSLGRPLFDPTAEMQREDVPRTILTANPALLVIGGNTQTGVSEPLIVVHAEDDTGGNNASISGFIFRSGHTTADAPLGGKGILVMRATSVSISGNQFEGNFTERIDLREGSARVELNYLTGPGDTCDICVAGPGVFSVSRNRLVDGGIPGILIVPATLLPVPDGVPQSTLPASATVQVTVAQNIIAGHQRVPVGVGIRVATVGINAASVQGLSNVRIVDNTLSHNRFGIIVEAGFPAAGSPLRGDAVVDLAHNVFVQNCQADLYLSFARHTTGLGLANTPYLRNSSYQVTVDAPRTVWYAHPAGFGNVLRINGDTVGNGVVHSYAADRVCP